MSLQLTNRSYRIRVHRPMGRKVARQQRHCSKQYNNSKNLDLEEG
jgi:hypothetical protein